MYSVTFPDDGRKIRLRRLRSIHGAWSLVGVRDQPAWVSGEGNQMVVLFAGGQWTGRPCMVPAKLLPEGTYRKYGEN